MYYSPATGAQPVQEPIIAGYRAQGWETGPAGYPLGNQMLRARRGGVLPGLRGRDRLRSHPSGAHAVRGAIFGASAALGLGAQLARLPTGARLSTSVPAARSFQTERYSSPRPYPLPPRGRATWPSGTGAMPLVGYPVQSEVCGLVGGGCLQVFATGSVYFSPATGAHAVRGAILGTWGALVGARPAGLPDRGRHLRPQQHRLLADLPARDRLLVAVDGCPQPPAATWPPPGPRSAAAPARSVPDLSTCGLVQAAACRPSPEARCLLKHATGTHSVSGPILQACGARGWETGALGYPVSSHARSPTGQRQRFQNGTLTVDTQSGTVTPS